MSFQGIQGLASFCLLLIFFHISEPSPTENSNRNEISPGRYVPEIYNARAKYVKDDSGLYRHIHVPYDGGYGDRGSKYQHSEPNQLQTVRRPFFLGPRDHLRFMIDFNYNGTGWQVIQFEWIHDDENGNEEHHYDYVNENKCCGAEDEVQDTNTDDGNNSQVHVKGEYDENSNNVTYTETSEENQTPYNPSDIQLTINEVLEYIQNNIIPNLL